MPIRSISATLAVCAALGFVATFYLGLAYVFIVLISWIGRTLGVA